MPFFSIPALPQVSAQPYVELRERFESRNNKNFDATTPDRRADVLSRYRIGIKAAFGKKWRGQIEYEYSHDYISSASRNYSTWNSDLSLGYLEADLSGWTVDLGRQRINLGSLYIVSCADWGNVTRSFDAVRVRNKEWDVSAGAVGLQAPTAERARFGALFHASPRFGSTLYLFRHDIGVDVHTLDHSYALSAAGLRFEAEGAIQLGRKSGKDQEGWAFHAAAALPKGRIRPYVEVNSASGGSTASVNRTFDVPFGATHGRFGMSDMLSWRNLNQLGIGADFLALKGLRIRAMWNGFSLRDPKDGWYLANGSTGSCGKIKFIDPTGTSGRDIGQEFGLDSCYTISKTQTLLAGAALFKPGKFVDNLTGHHDRMLFGYVQFSFKF